MTKERDQVIAKFQESEKLWQHKLKVKENESFKLQKLAEDARSMQSDQLECISKLTYRVRALEG